jgi:hypothetical protein
MKKLLVLILTGALLILTVACTQDANVTLAPDETVDGQTYENPVAGDDNNPKDGLAVDDWAGDELAYRFINSMNNLALIYSFVSSEEMDNFVESLGLDQRPKEDVPFVYSAIMYFGITEESFRETNNKKIEFNEQHGTEGVTYTDEEISALYCGDISEMVQRLKSPYAFVNGKDAYNVFDLVKMDEDGLLGAEIDLDELDEYCDWIQDEINIRPEQDHEWFEEKLDNLRVEIKAARLRCK